MKLLLLALFCSCTQVERIAVVAPAPPSSIEGTYVASWSGGVTGQATITSDSIVFEPYPCFLQGGETKIGGTYGYDLADGSFAAELKTVGGTVKVTLEGQWRGEPPEFVGSYIVQFLGAECDEGTLTLK